MKQSVPVKIRRHMGRKGGGDVLVAAVRVRHAPSFDRPLPSGVSQIGGLQKSSKGRPFSHPLHTEQRYTT